MHSRIRFILLVVYMSETLSASIGNFVESSSDGFQDVLQQGQNELLFRNDRGKLNVHGEVASNFERSLNALTFRTAPSEPIPKSPVEKVICGEIEPLTWLSDRKGRAFGELEDVSKKLEQLHENTQKRITARSMIYSRGLACNELTTLSPLGDSLSTVLPPNETSSCQSVVLPTEGSTLSIECPFFSVGQCKDEYLFITDGMKIKNLYCDGRRVEKLYNLKQLYVLYERRTSSNKGHRAFCVIEAKYNVQPTEEKTANDEQICPHSCGVASSNVGVVRIIGGSRASRGEYPWIVNLFIKMKNGQAFQCGGSIINTRNVLTAAHCLADSDNIDYVGLTIGRLGSAPEPGEQRLAVKDWTIHRNYNHASGQYLDDIAMLHLHQDLVIGETATPVCLAPVANYQNQLAVVAGWGVTSTNGGTLSSDLLEVGVTVTSQSMCAATYANSGLNVTNKQLCASEAGRDSCQGDSGGPLVIQSLDRWYQIGIVSFGIGCADPVFPGVYTAVSSYNAWIKDNTKEGSC